MIRLQESLRAVFYAPFYAALARDAYAHEEVAVRFLPADGTSAARGLTGGTTDVLWGGPMRVNWLHDRDPDSDLVCFGEVVTRDPFFVVGHKPAPDFRIGDLAGRKLGSVSEVPTPWMCLQEDVRRAGADPAAIDRVHDRTMAQNAEAVASGALDAAQLFQPFAEQLVATGKGHIWYAAADRGPCSYTTFYTRRTTLDDKRAELRRLVRAIYRTQKWIAAATPDAIAAAIAPYFHAVPAARLSACCARYQRLGIWGRDPILPRGGYDRLCAGLISGGLIRAAVPFERAVDNTLAEEAIAADPPPLP